MLVSNLKDFTHHTWVDKALVYIFSIGAIIIGFVMYYRSKNSSSYTDVHVKDLGFLIKEQDAILIDVRTPKEIAAGVIGQPLEIELGLGMKEKFKSLDKNKKYILYCRSGRRSVTASKIMAGLGFSDVNNLVGGYIAWKNGE